MGNVGTVSRVFDGDTANVAFTVYVEQRVFIEIFSLSHFSPYGIQCTKYQYPENI